MDEPNQADAPQRYTWPKYVLAGVVLGIVLAIFWMAVLVRRISQQREDMVWPTNTVAPISPATQAISNTPAATSAAPAH